jgi:excisionase family DNA binding protein
MRKIRIKALAEKKGLSARTIYRLINAKKLVAHKFNNLTLLDEEEADRFFESLPAFEPKSAA